MSIKKIMAAAAASVVAVSAMSVAASAVSVGHTIEGSLEGGVGSNLKLADLGITTTFAGFKVAKVEVDITCTNTENGGDGFAGNGNIGANLPDAGWSAMAAAQEGFKAGETTTWTWETPDGIEDDDSLQISIYWLNPEWGEDGPSEANSVTIEAVRLLDKDGNDLLAAPAADETPSDETPSETPTEAPTEEAAEAPAEA